MRVCIKRKDGGVTIFYPTKEVEGGELVALLDKLEHPELFQRESYRTMGEDEVLPDTYFRNAWVDNGKVSVDLEKAKQVQVWWAEKEAEKKKKALKGRIDEAYLSGAGLEELQAEYKEINAAVEYVADNVKDKTTLEEIKAVWPECLKTEKGGN